MVYSYVSWLLGTRCWGKYEEVGVVSDMGEYLGAGLAQTLRERAELNLQPYCPRCRRLYRRDGRYGKRNM